jgi:hypothetical protein
MSFISRLSIGSTRQTASDDEGGGGRGYDGDDQMGLVLTGAHSLDRATKSQAEREERKHED